MCNSAATRPSSQITLGRLVYLRNECSTIYTYAKYNNWMIKRKVKNCKMIITWMLRSREAETWRQTHRRASVTEECHAFKQQSCFVGWLIPLAAAAAQSCITRPTDGAYEVDVPSWRDSEWKHVRHGRASLHMPSPPRTRVASFQFFALHCRTSSRTSSSMSSWKMRISYWRARHECRGGSAT